MAHPQIVRAHIEGKDFTLYYDYDQLRDGKLSPLTEGGKIDWFRLRMQFVFLKPIERLFTAKSPAYRELNSTKPDDSPALSFVIASFSLLLNGIEALGSFLTPKVAHNKARFYAFIENYMKPWGRASPMGTANLKAILWDHFRNGIAMRRTPLRVGGSLRTPLAWQRTLRSVPARFFSTSGRVLTCFLKR